MKATKALLIIDMQKGSFTPDQVRWDAGGVVMRINAVADQFRKSGDLVIFVQHDGSRFGEFIPKNEDWEILDDLKISTSDLIVAKTANDSFYESKLDQILKEEGIDELWISGCATDYCVEATIQSALAKDYNVKVLRDCHTTKDKEYLTAEQIRAHYNFIWNDLIPTRGSVEVLASFSS